jgi:hypothetical protein
MGSRVARRIDPDTEFRAVIDDTGVRRTDDKRLFGSAIDLDDQFALLRRICDGVFEGKRDGA